VRDGERRQAWPPSIRPFGDSAVLIEIEGEAALERAAVIHGVAEWLEDALPPEAGWGRPVPGATTILLPFDPIEPGLERAMSRVREVLDQASPEQLQHSWPDRPRTVEIPVRYGGAGGPDLESVAASLGLPVDDVVLGHASRIYRVLFIGFVAGFAYCGTLPAELALPRRSTPRTHVPAGSVVIAGRMTSVLPVPTPSGWHVIGRTDEAMWDIGRQVPGLLQPGDAVRFMPEDGR
jgi:KipI family sensor histidine kinase inhibitor